MSRIFSQDNQETNLKVIEYKGIVGVFVPEDQFREATENIEKGFVYYKNWKLSEVQIVKYENVIANDSVVISNLEDNWDKEKENTKDLTDLKEQCVLDRDEAILKLGVAIKAKNFMLYVALPVIGGATFVGGAYLGYQAGLQAAK